MSPLEHLAVVPVLIGPLQVLAAILPAILAALGTLLLRLFSPRTLGAIVRLVWKQKFALLTAIAVIAGGVYGWGMLFPPENVVGAAQGEWPLFRGTPERTGNVSTDGSEPAQGGIVWANNVEKTFYSSPVVIGKKVFAVSATYTTYKDAGTIYCFDADKGTILWRFRDSGQRATFSSPAVADGGKVLVVGEGLHYTEDARVYCIDISGEKSSGPLLLWKYRTGSHVESSPCVYEGKVYIGAGDDGYYCFKLRPSEPGKAEVLWHLPGPKSKDKKPGGPVYPDAESCPVAFEGKVYLGLGIGGKALCCVDAETGKELWRIETPYPVFAPPAISRTRKVLFIAMGNGDFVNTAEQVKLKVIEKMKSEGKSEAEIERATRNLGPVGEVWCIDISGEKPEIKWKFKTGRIVLGAVVVDEDRVFFSSRDQHVYAVDMEGNLVAKKNIYKRVVSSPAMGRRFLYLMAEDGTVYALEKKSLEIVWEENLGPGQYFFSSPAVGNGHVYVGTSGRGLVCLGRPAGFEKTEVWNGTSGYIGSGMIPEKGVYASRYPQEKEGTESRTARFSPLACTGKYVVFGMVEADTPYLAALGVDEKTYSLKEHWKMKLTLPVYTSPVATSQQDVYFVTGKEGDGGRKLYCIDVEEKRVIWSMPVEAQASGMLGISEDYLLVQPSPKTLLCIDRRKSIEGNEAVEAWRREIGGITAAPLVLGDLLITVSGRQVTVMDAPSGLRLWEKDVPAVASCAPVVVRSSKEEYVNGATHQIYTDALLVGTRKGLYAMDLLDGTPLWKKEKGRIDKILAMKDGYAAAVVGNKDSAVLSIIDTLSGKTVRTLSGIVPAGGLLYVSGKLIFATRRSIRILADPLKGRHKRWMKTSWLGKPVVPIAGMNKTVFICTAKKGLVCTKPRKK